MLASVLWVKVGYVTMSTMTTPLSGQFDTGRLLFAMINVSTKFEFSSPVKKIKADAKINKAIDGGVMQR